jgi:heat shock protein 1/8
VAIGIDLGTTYSCVGVWNRQKGAVEIIADESGNRTTPSYVSFTSSGERLVGESAKTHASQEPENTVLPPPPPPLPRAPAGAPCPRLFGAHRRGPAATDRCPTPRVPCAQVFDAKRLIGRKITDPSVISDKEHWPFKVVDGGGGRPQIIIQYQGEERKFFAEEISAMVLQRMKVGRRAQLHAAATLLLARLWHSPDRLRCCG